jgi:RNA polymerase sigma factor (sigma-70 family)
VTPRRPAPQGVLVAALRQAAPRAVAAVTRRIGDFDDAEDAVQEALVAAARQWPQDGIPDEPAAWLTTVAVRRAIDQVRSDAARRDRELRIAMLDAESAAVSAVDDTLALYALCCHPALPRAAQVPLTLRAVAGLSTREIARGLLLSEATVAQRISRAKATLRAAGARFDDADLAERIPTILDVLGLVHTESHSAAEGEAITRPELAAEALRLARQLLVATPSSTPWHGEVRGLVALMLFTSARAPARVAADGSLVALADQNRSLWRQELIAEADDLLTAALTRHPLGPFQLRAAIAGLHDAAPSFAETDWRELLALYDLLRVVDPGPVVELARLVPFAEVHGADAALRLLDDLAPRTPAVRVAAVRAHLLTRAGRPAAAAYREAAGLAGNGAERRWLEARAAD